MAITALQKEGREQLIKEIVQVNLKEESTTVPAMEIVTVN